MSNNHFAQIKMKPNNNRKLYKKYPKHYNNDINCGSIKIVVQYTI